ncbi:glycoside hydrolase family 17 protein [Suhomyces tanzawaensis NRRL Y-17324]|uniref:glucan endo-1,3-beta-D-glucosidase n=1 Tax=Suhomyces tanzawaensis NRRL Y-17324 TaxID=984487 RepID=A0A1E4SQE4_9ASCO|nr:glycoside hydrolase family 17 protein [Suhomyces tanzawaensis NRRL Y-17324]ODV81733.1 glycoside hydrolase family 17 protein [Suhomyces tanzawaensis NRRL Y-17324]
MSEKPQLTLDHPEESAPTYKQHAKSAEYNDDTISNEPKPNPGMSLHPNRDSSSSDEGSSYMDMASGYDQNLNECTEFCIELSTCFGLLETCCPANGEGCLTTSAVFCGNILSDLEFPLAGENAEASGPTSTVSLPAVHLMLGLKYLPLAPEKLAKASSVDCLQEPKEKLNAETLCFKTLVTPVAPHTLRVATEQSQNALHTRITAASSEHSNGPVNQRSTLPGEELPSGIPLTSKYTVCHNLAGARLAEPVLTEPVQAKALVGTDPTPSGANSAIFKHSSNSKNVLAKPEERVTEADSMKLYSSNESIDSAALVSTAGQFQPSMSNESEDLNPSTIGQRSRMKYKIPTIFLTIMLVLMLACFIPSIVILSLGTRKSVINYFARNRDQSSFLQDLVSLYSNESTYSRPSQVNDSNVSWSLLSMNDTLGDLLSEPQLDLFYGLAYSPRNAMEPNCGLTREETLLDIAKISRVTTRVRNYGMQCNQTEFILDAIQTLNLNMTLAMGVWIGSNWTVNNLQLLMMNKLLKRYPEKMFESVFIGNEVLFREDILSNELILTINTTRKYLHSLGYTIPVGTSDLGSLISADLIQACDIIGANIHPFFGGGHVDNAVDWALNFLKYQLEPMNLGNTKIAITEVGWPTSGGNHQSAVANLDNFRRFVGDFICKSKNIQNPYYFFEAFDEPWKKIFYEQSNKWETEWGIFHTSRKNKIDWSTLEKC